MGLKLKNSIKITNEITLKNIDYFCVQHIPCAKLLSEIKILRKDSKRKEIIKEMVKIKETIFDELQKKQLI